MHQCRDLLKQHKWIPFVVVILIVLDQWTKVLAVKHLSGGRRFTIIDGFFDFSLVYNTGAAFGFGADWPLAVRRLLFLVISCLAVVVMGYLLHKLRHNGWLPVVGITLIMSGAIGNLIDRFRLGHVVDYIHVFYKTYHYPNFNVADSAISVGITLFAIFLLWGDNKPKSAA